MQAYYLILGAMLLSLVAVAMSLLTMTASIYAAKNKKKGGK